MSKPLTEKALAIFKAKGDVWQEVLDGAREIKAGEDKRTTIEVTSCVIRVRVTSHSNLVPSSEPFAFSQ